MIDGHDEAVAQALSLVLESRVKTRTGEVVPVLVDTLCVHGDRDDAVELARATRAALEKAGVQITALGRRDSYT